MRAVVAIGEFPVGPEMMMDRPRDSALATITVGDASLYRYNRDAEFRRCWRPRSS
jgi:hypothetical protein